MDLENTTVQENEKIGEIRSDEQEVLAKLKPHIGNSQVTVSHIEWAPPWLINKYIQEEHDGIWEGAYTPVKEIDIPRNANVIS